MACLCCKHYHVDRLIIWCVFKMPLDFAEDGTYCLFTISRLITWCDGSREIDLIFSCVAMNVNFPRRCNLCHECFVVDISVSPSVGENVAVIVSLLSQLNRRSNDLWLQWYGVIFNPKIPEPGNVDSKSHKMIHKSNDMPTTWQFQERENKTCIRTPPPHPLSLRAINKSNFTLMGTERKRETKQIYG